MATKGKVKDMIALLERDGWVKVAQVGSHRQYKHKTKPGRVTVSGHKNGDVDPKLWNSMLSQAGLR